MEAFDNPTGGYLFRRQSKTLQKPSAAAWLGISIAEQEGYCVAELTRQPVSPRRGRLTCRPPIRPVASPFPHQGSLTVACHRSAFTKSSSTAIESRSSEMLAACLSPPAAHKHGASCTNVAGAFQFRSSSASIAPFAVIRQLETPQLSTATKSSSCSFGRLLHEGRHQWLNEESATPPARPRIETPCRVLYTSDMEHSLSAAVFLTRRSRHG